MHIYIFFLFVKVCSEFGNAILDTTKTIAQGVAIAYGLDKNFFVEKMKMAPNLLAPTGTDLKKYNQVGDVFAGYHAGK